MIKIKEEINNYLIKKNWNSHKEGKTVFYYKDRNPFEIKENEFLSYSKRKKPMSLQNFINKTEEYFNEKNFSRKVLNSIINDKKDTIFIVAGIQYFSDIIFGKQEGDGIKYFVPQPVIRTKYRDYVGEGSISSFVNLSTMQSPTSPENHLSHIDDWMNYLSKLGLNIKDFVLRLNESNGEDWAGHWSKTHGNILFFDYGGLEIGDAGYLQIENKPPITDIGFGLERILWAVNKERFSDLIGPIPFSFEEDYSIMDSIRTTTLISLSGLGRKDKEALSQFKIYMTKIKNKRDFNIYEIVKHYYNFWNKFVNPLKKFDETFSLIQNEFNRQKNLDLVQKLGFQKTPKTLQKYLSSGVDIFIHKLIEENLSNLKDIRKIIYSTTTPK